MSGHSHWAGIKHKKGVADKKRGQLFGKLLNAITIAAREETNVEFNPRLKSAVEKARQNNVPQENIERAIKRASEKNTSLESIICEAYGPGGSAIIIEAVTDSKNRTISEIKNILSENNGKWAEHGSVLWAFQSKQGNDGSNRWSAKFPQKISNEDSASLQKLVDELNSSDDIHNVYTNSL